MNTSSTPDSFKSPGPLKPAPPVGVVSVKPATSKLAKLVAKAVAKNAVLPAAPAAAPAAAPEPAPLGQTADDPPPPASTKSKLDLRQQPEITEDDRPSKTRLAGFASTIAGRVKDIEEIFGDTAHSPMKNRDFKKFLSDQVAEVAMRYVRVGVVHSEDADAITPDEREKRMAAKGFTVGQAEKAKADEKKKEAEATDDSGTTTSAGQVDEHDQRFLSSTIVQQATSLGFDPNSED